MVRRVIPKIYVISGFTSKDQVFFFDIFFLSLVLKKILSNQLYQG